MMHPSWFPLTPCARLLYIVYTALVMHVLLACACAPPRYLSGYQTRFLATIRELIAAGCEVLVVTPGKCNDGV